MATMREKDPRLMTPGAVVAAVLGQAQREQALEAMIEDGRAELAASRRDKPLVLPCTTEDIQGPIRERWEELAEEHGFPWREFIPHVDGHMGVGFSIRLFGPPTPEPTDATRAAYRALEALLRVLENLGLEVTRDGNEYQEGRLVLGWSAHRRAYDTEIQRFCDLSDFHPARIARRERLERERQLRDAEAAR